MKKILSILLTIGILAGLVLPLVSTQPVYAAKGEQPKKVVEEVLQPGEKRLSANIKVVRIGGSATSGTYEAYISSLPKTMPDLKTLITLEWRQGAGEDGKSYFVTGNNLYYAKVTGTRVSTEYKGKLAAWDPTIVIAGKTLNLVSGPEVVDDIINPNYKGNTIKWVYSADIGTFLFKREYEVTRYLRQIEGVQYELYKLPYDPRADVEIITGYKAEGGFQWALPAFAYDSNYKDIPVTSTKTSKIVKAGDLTPRNNIKFPIYIDPTLDLSTTSSSDGFLYGDDVSYSTTRTQSAADYATSITPAINVGQRYDGSTYYIARTAVGFDTSALPDNAVISASALYLYGSWTNLGTNFNITIQNGMPTYPHEPVQVGDYYYTYYAGNGGQLYTSGFSTTAYNLLNLNSTGISWINKTGQTKFLLRSDREISGTAPTGYEYLGIDSYDYGTGYAPEMRVVYTVPVVTPTINTYTAYNVEDTSATLYGIVLDDGGAAVSVNFKYGLTTSYEQVTPVLSGYTTGQTFSQTVYGLEKGTLYHYTAVATNSEEIGRAHV